MTTFTATSQSAIEVNNFLEACYFTKVTLKNVTVKPAGEYDKYIQFTTTAPLETLQNILRDIADCSTFLQTLAAQPA
jgi:hypothetical protein